MYVIDASALSCTLSTVLYPWSCVPRAQGGQYRVHVADARPQEPHHAEARALLAQVAAEGRAVYLPAIVLAEVASAISRGTGQPALAQRLTAALRRVPHFQFVPVDGALGQLAAELAADQQLRGCDAVYVALAQQRGATLITLDRQQQERVPPAVVARTPAEELVEIHR